MGLNASKDSRMKRNVKKIKDILLVRTRLVEDCSNSSYGFLTLWKIYPKNSMIPVKKPNIYEENLENTVRKPI